MMKLAFNALYGANTVFCMQDKESSIPHDDLGKNIATVQVLQRKHETFEREVLALGNKVYNMYVSLFPPCTVLSTLVVGCGSIRDTVELS